MQPRDNRGFTLVELMITVAVFLFVIIAGSQIFTALLTQFKQQSKIAETNIEGVVGLDILRRDIAHAGFGLPWSIPAVVGYNEAVADGATPFVDTNLNDGPPANPTRGTEIGGASNPPGAIRSGKGGGLNGSDVLTIKATNVAMNDTAQKWSYIWKQVRGSLPNTMKQWNSTSVDDIPNSDYIMVLNPGTGSNQNILVNNAGVFYTTRADNTCSFFSGSTSASCVFEPDIQNTDNWVVYGLAPYDAATNTTPRMPFNRADYYIKRPSSMPARCAPNTGVLYKGTVNHNVHNSAADPKAGIHSELPLMDCVAFMEVDYWLDTSATPDGIVDWVQPDGACGSAPQPSPTQDISCLTATQIRQQLKEVRVYVIAHEGQRDPKFDFSGGNPIKVTEILGGQSRQLTFDVSAILNNPDYKYYRWKLYTLVIQPSELQGR